MGPDAKSPRAHGRRGTGRPRRQSPTTKAAADGVNTIQLQAHQRAVRDYLVRDCCKLPGVVLFHGVGTGKTITALAVMSALSGAHRGIIFCPSSLTGMWEGEVAAYRRSDGHGPGNAAYPRVCGMQDLAAADVRDAVVVVDEAHQWLEALFSADKAARARAGAAFRNLATAHRRLLLTASPVISLERGMFDLGCLVNLAAGRAVFPFAYYEFKKRLVSVPAADVLWGGWAWPVLLQVFHLVYFLHIATAYIAPLQQASTLAWYAWFAAFLPGAHQNGSPQQQQQSGISAPPAPPAPPAPTDGGPGTSVPARTWAGWWGGFGRAAAAWAAAQLASTRTRAAVGLTGLAKVARPFLALQVVSWLVRTKPVSYMQNRIFQTARGLDTVNVHKFMAACQGYCSVLPAAAASLPDQQGDFPTAHQRVVYADLTEEQHLAWMEMADKVLGVKTLKALGIAAAHGTHGGGAGDGDTAANLNLAYQSTASLQYMDYIDNGRRLGLLGDAPPKLVNMLQLMAGIGFRRCVVYSHFDSTAAKVRSFLAAHAPRDVAVLGLGPPASRYSLARTLDTFARSQRSVLILHPEMYYGISIRGASQLHVLEPPVDMVRKTQLLGRVVRYGSHAHLPAAERRVEIVMHVSRVSPDAKRQVLQLVSSLSGYELTDIRLKLKHSAKHEAAMAPLVMRWYKQQTHKSKSTDQTPDSVVLSLLVGAEHDMQAYATGNGRDRLVPACPPALRCAAGMPAEDNGPRDGARATSRSATGHEATMAIKAGRSRSRSRRDYTRDTGSRRHP